MKTEALEKYGNVSFQGSGCEGSSNLKKVWEQMRSEEQVQRVKVQSPRTWRGVTGSSRRLPGGGVRKARKVSSRTF